MKKMADILASLQSSGNLRRIPADDNGGCIDLSSNDYLGIAADRSLRARFLDTLTADTFLPSSSASRLLAARQDTYARLENLLSKAYGRPALLFNSGYHANTGIVQALGGKDTLFVADKLVHASIIDGLKLSGSVFRRFRHNDTAHLVSILEKEGKEYNRVVIIAESVYSMDGDSPDIPALIAAKQLHSNALLMIDEAHAVGVLGPQGLGLTHGLSSVDIMVGTLGKALGSVGAYAITDGVIHDYLVNTCRSLIFSTALPPVNVAWSMFALEEAMKMDGRREHLRNLAAILAPALGIPASRASHIMPFVVGDARLAIGLSAKLKDAGVKVLPIRTPTVPPGTERLRFSLSADISTEAMEHVAHTVNNICKVNS